MNEALLMSLCVFGVVVGTILAVLAICEIQDILWKRKERFNQIVVKGVNDSETKDKFTRFIEAALDALEDEEV